MFMTGIVYALGSTLRKSNHEYQDDITISNKKVPIQTVQLIVFGRLDL